MTHSGESYTEMSSLNHITEFWRKEERVGEVKKEDAVIVVRKTLTTSAATETNNSLNLLRWIDLLSLGV